MIISIFMLQTPYYNLGESHFRESRNLLLYFVQLNETWHFQFNIYHRAAGPYKDTRTGPNQVLRPSKVPRTGPNQVLDINCWRFLKRVESQGMDRSLEKKYLMSNEKVLSSVLLCDIVFSVCSGRDAKIWSVLTMFWNTPAALLKQLDVAGWSVNGLPL